MRWLDAILYTTTSILQCTVHNQFLMSKDILHITLPPCWPSYLTLNARQSPGYISLHGQAAPQPHHCYPQWPSVLYSACNHPRIQACIHHVDVSISVNISPQMQVCMFCNLHLPSIHARCARLSKPGRISMGSCGQGTVWC